MMALWMAYALVLSLLFAAAARVAEKGLDLYERPTRWVWIAAMAGAVAVPIAAHAVIGGWALGADPGPAAGGGATAASAGGSAVPVLPSVDLLEAGAAADLADRLRFLDPWLLGGWAVASLVTAGWLLTGWLQLRSLRRRWTEAEVDGVDVLISPDRGPAITGFLKGMILLPSWFEELDGDLRPLVLRHEREHLAVGDHRLLAAALVGVALFPWNPVLWWNLARLRQAMEIDCDRRVLGDGVSRADYAELLVQIGERASGPSLSAAAFAGSSSLLERRIRRLSSRGPRARIGKAAVAVVAAVGLGGAIGWVPVPDEPVELSRLQSAELVASAPSSAASDRPTGERPARVVPPAPAVMKLDLRLYMAEGDPSGASGAAEGKSERKLDMEAVRLAKQLSYACAPYLNGAAASEARSAGSGRHGGTSRSGCFVVVDGEPTHPSVLRKLSSGSISSIRILPPEESVERFGSGARKGAYIIETKQG